MQLPPPAQPRAWNPLLWRLRSKPRHQTDAHSSDQFPLSCNAVFSPQSGGRTSAISATVQFGRESATDRVGCALNVGKEYPDRIKPFNFILTAQVAPGGHPDGADTNRFRLIAPYESDPRKWLKQYWIDQYTGDRYHITTEGYYGGETSALVKTYGRVVDAYESHTESKCADDAGIPCRKKTVGLLQRRHVYIGRIRRIGKESNRLESVQSGQISSERDVYVDYPDPADDEWLSEILPALKKMRLSDLIKESEISKRALMDIRVGLSMPQSKNQELLTAIVRKLQTTGRLK